MAVVRRKSFAVDRYHVSMTRDMNGVSERVPFAAPSKNSSQVFRKNRLTAIFRYVTLVPIETKNEHSSQKHVTYAVDSGDSNSGGGSDLR